jgi:16S rRNA (guanine1207-N2)-methyltransferase
VANARQRKPLESLARILPLAEGPLKVISLPGVFSHGRLDRGSALLLEHLDKLPAAICWTSAAARVCWGGGQTSLPAQQVTLLDVDAFAAASSRLTLAANGLEAEVITGDGIDAAPMGLNAILSNPPFHVGVHTDYFATENLLRKAAKHLKKAANCAWWRTAS